MSNRHLARTIAMQSLFMWDFNGKKEADIKEIIKGNFSNFAPSFNDNGFVEKLIKGVMKNLSEIDKHIIKYATEWPLDQITITDRNILRIGVYELVFSEDIPPKVAINEAIEIAKTFGGESSGKFVNGVLGAIYKDRPELEKTGGSQSGKSPKEGLMGERQFSVGGVVYRRFPDGLKIALILDGHGRWTFSKGKIKPGEDYKKALIRELGEEMGLKELKIGEKIGEIELIVRDPDSKPCPKTVYMYLVEAVDDKLSPAQNTGELSDAKWYDFDEAEKTLGYDKSQEVWQKAKKMILK